MMTRVNQLSDDDLAAELAAGAGRLLVATRAGGLLSGMRLGDVGDSVAQTWLAAVLSTHRPRDAVRSEEAHEDPRRATADRVWIIDPLDGTREYREGRDDWAVHIALTVGGEPVASAVALPARDEVYRSDTVDRVGGALTGVLVSSRSGHPFEAAAVAATLGMRIAPLGSAGAKAMAVVRGEADAYVHAGGQYEWDSCAPVGVALAAGLHCSRLDGSPLQYNRPSPYLPDFIMCRAEIAADVLAAVPY